MLIDARATLPGGVQLALLNAWILDISLGLVQQGATFEPRHHTCCYLNLATKCRPLCHPSTAPRVLILIQKHNLRTYQVLDYLPKTPSRCLWSHYPQK